MVYLGMRDVVAHIYPILGVYALLYSAYALVRRNAMSDRTNINNQKNYDL
jgi:hypothetical protein